MTRKKKSGSIRKSIVPIIRITSRNSNGTIELKGTLRILLQQELIFFRKKHDLIRSNAQIMYNQKASGDTSAGYVKTAPDFRGIEKSCDAYVPSGFFSI